MQLVKSEIIILGVKVVKEWRSEMFVKVGKLKSLSFLPISVKNYFCNIKKRFLFSSFARILLQRPKHTPTATTACVGCCNDHLESPLFLSEPSGWHSGPCIRSTPFKVQRDLLWENCKTEKVIMAQMSSLASTPKEFEVLQNQLSQCGLSWKHMR